MDFKDPKLHDNQLISLRPFMPFQSKRKESFDFKDQSCVLNNEHDFIDEVTDSMQ